MIVKLGGTLLLCTLAVFIGLAIVQAGTDITHSSIDKTMRKWVCARERPDVAQITRAISQLDTAIRFNPFNADLYFQKAQLTSVYSASYPLWHESSKRIRDDTDLAYRAALHVRPAWAMAWINLFQNRLLGGNVDEHTYSMIDKIMETGKWQSDVQAKLIWLSFGIWESISDKQKTRLAEHIAQVMSTDHMFYAAIAAANHFNMLDTIIEFHLDAATRRKLNAVLADQDELKRIATQNTNTNSYC